MTGPDCKVQMGYLWRGKLACLSLLLLLLLMLFQLEAAQCFAQDHHQHGNKFSSFRFRAGSSPPIDHSTKVHKGFRRNTDSDEDDDEIFGAEMRKVYTGPNPLHNR